MSSYDDDDPPPPRRESIMEQRLRRARGEVDDEPFEDVGYSPARLPRYGGGPGAGGGGGCAQATLYLVIGGIVLVLIMLFAGNSLIDRIGGIFDPAGTLAELAATPTTVVIDRGATIRQIQALSRLETARYAVETVVPVSKDTTIGGIPLPDFVGGDELLLIASGQVIAGVDLSKLRPEDVQISPDGESITINLPPTEVFVANLDQQRTQVYSRERGLFAPDNKDLETQARQAAQARIMESACEGGIMQNATEEAQRSVERLIGLMDFERVEVRAQPGACVDPQLPGATAIPAQPTTAP
jgi:hypothetical protein